MTMRVGVLNNLRAGRSASRVARVLRELRRHPDVVHVETETGCMVPEALAELAREDVELLIVNGGDGTIQRVLTELLGSGRGDWLPILAPVRGGRTNMTALDLGAHRKPARMISELIESVRAGTLGERVVERPVLRVDLGGQDGVHYGMFFAVGMIYRAIRLTHRLFPTGRAQGVFGAGVMTGALVTRAATGRLSGVLDPDKLQIVLDGTPVEPAEFTLAMATTLDRLFLRMRPFWGAEALPVRVTAIAAGARGLRTAAPGLVRGRPPAHATPETGYTSRNVEHAAIQLDCGSTLDGELFAPEPGRVVHLRADDRVRFVRS
jgi:hypothetical protein